MENEKVLFWRKITDLFEKIVNVYKSAAYFVDVLFAFRSVKEDFAQTSEIITYEADAQAVFRHDVEVNKNNAIINIITRNICTIIISYFVHLFKIQTEEEPEREIKMGHDDSQVF